jgi:hypothetical protein
MDVHQFMLNRIRVRVNLTWGRDAWFRWYATEQRGAGSFRRLTINKLIEPVQDVGSDALVKQAAKSA